MEYKEYVCRGELYAIGRDWNDGLRGKIVIQKNRGLSPVIFPLEKNHTWIPGCKHS